MHETARPQHSPVHWVQVVVQELHVRVRVHVHVCSLLIFQNDCLISMHYTLHTEHIFI